jgi:protein-tyrosine phosphatase
VYRHLCSDDIDRVVIHCHRGRNRSVSVVTAALARYEDRPVSDVLFDVYDARDIIEPNDRMLWNAVTYARIFE